MIKKIKHFICKIFYIRACKCKTDKPIKMHEEVRLDKTEKIRKKYKGTSE